MLEGHGLVLQRRYENWHEICKYTGHLAFLTRGQAYATIYPESYPARLAASNHQYAARIQLNLLAELFIGEERI